MRLSSRPLPSSALKLLISITLIAAMVSPAQAQISERPGLSEALVPVGKSPAGLDGTGSIMVVRENDAVYRGVNQAWFKNGKIFACFHMAEPFAPAGDMRTAPSAFTADKVRIQPIAFEVAYPKSSFAANAADRTSVPRQNPAKKRSWIGRHPVLFGTLVGFGAGFAYGYKTGDPSARNCPGCDNLTPETKGVLFGGIGAGIGAVAGLIIGAVGK